MTQNSRAYWNRIWILWTLQSFHNQRQFIAKTLSNMSPHLRPSAATAAMKNVFWANTAMSVNYTQPRPFAPNSQFHDINCSAFFTRRKSKLQKTVAFSIHYPTQAECGKILSIDFFLAFFCRSPEFCTHTRSISVKHTKRLWREGVWRAKKNLHT